MTNPFSKKIKVTEKNIKQAKKLSSFKVLKSILKGRKSSPIFDEFQEKYFDAFMDITFQLEDGLNSFCIVDRGIEPEDLETYLKRKEDLLDMGKDVFDEFQDFCQKIKNNTFGKWVVQDFFYVDRSNDRNFYFVTAGSTKNKKNNDNYDFFFTMAKGEFTKEPEDPKDKKFNGSKSQRMAIKYWLNILTIKSYRELLDFDDEESEDL